MINFLLYLINTNDIDLYNKIIYKKIKMYKDIPEEIKNLICNYKLLLEIKYNNIDNNNIILNSKLKIENPDYLILPEIIKFIENFIMIIKLNKKEILYINYNKEYIESENNIFFKLLIMVLYNYIDNILIPNIKDKFQKKINLYNK